jgi:hypothetical protein
MANANALSKTPDLVDPARGEGAAPQKLSDGVVLMFERLATNPDVNVEKLERLIAMQERILRHNAEMAFHAAFAEMQGELPTISERGEILVNGVVRSRYAPLEDIVEVVRPILKKYGFALRHRNQFTGDKLKVIGILSHRAGHSETDEFEAKADTSGSKNDIQSFGSTQSYGQRYTTKNLLGIVTRGEDKDGYRPPTPATPPPSGYDDWLIDLESVADEGLARLSQAWNSAKPEYRRALLAADKQRWEALKRRAKQVGS